MDIETKHPVPRYCGLIRPRLNPEEVRSKAERHFNDQMFSLFGDFLHEKENNCIDMRPFLDERIRFEDWERYPNGDEIADEVYAGQKKYKGMMQRYGFPDHESYSETFMLEYFRREIKGIAGHELDGLYEIFPNKSMSVIFSDCVIISGDFDKNSRPKPPMEEKDGIAGYDGGGVVGEKIIERKLHSEQEKSQEYQRTGEARIKTNDSFSGVKTGGNPIKDKRPTSASKTSERETPSVQSCIVRQ